MLSIYLFSQLTNFTPFKDSVRTKNLKKSKKHFFALSDIIFYDNSKYIYEYAESVSLRMVMTPLISLLLKKCTHFRI